MPTSTELWEKIYSTTHSSRELLVAYVQTVADEAKQFPLDQLAKKSSKVPPRQFPDTIGEDIANKINSALIIQDWIDYETADDLADICEISGRLEMAPSDKELWQELFKKIDKLRA